MVIEKKEDIEYQPEEKAYANYAFSSAVLESGLK